MHKKKSNIERIFPLTPLQEGMLFHYVEGKSTALYFEQSKISINSNLDLDACKESLEILSKKHDVLRSAVVYKSVSVPRQLILADRVIEMNFVDFSDKEESTKLQEIENIKLADIERGFDLERDPLMRVTIIKKHQEAYCMLWSFHHIIMDGWCLSIIFSDFLEIYEKVKSGLFPKENLIRQYQMMTKGKYEEYVRWLSKQDKPNGLRYWEELLNGYDSNADIVSDISKQEVSIKKGNSIVESLEISEELSEKLEKIAKENHVTVNTIFEAIWGILLKKYTYCEDVVFGKVVSGRNVPIRNVEQVVGLFINTIPVRIGEHKGAFVELIKEVQEQANKSSKYDFCSLAEIQALKKNSSLVHNIIAFENYYSDEKALDKAKELLNFEVDALHEETNYPLNLVVSKDNTFLIKLIYLEDVYSNEFIKGILKHLEACIDIVVNNPFADINEIEIITNSEKELIFNKFNATTTKYPKEKTIVELFEEQVERMPEEVAVTYKEETITYRRLNEKANVLAKKLLKAKVEIEDKIAVVGEKKIETIIAIIAILKVGAAYMPIDKNYPDERKQFMLKDGDVKCVLTTEALEEEYFNQLLVIDLMEEEISNDTEKENLKVSIVPNNLAYVIYTSGSTGGPKGVLVEHKSVVRLVKNTNIIDFDDARILQTGAIAFDASTFEIWGALLNGGVLSLFDTEELLDMEKLQHEIETKEINTLWLTAKLFNEIVSMRINIFDKVKYLLIGGEKLSEEHVNMLIKSNKNIKLINGYGPTENTTFSTTYEIAEEMKSIPIGKPIANSTAYILNKNIICGIGMIGELCVAGDGLARGYLNNLELTSKKFVTAPWNSNEVIYRTGDLARFRNDGNIEYLGRLDNQVKIRGFRIEPGEIENEIVKVQGVVGSVVLPIDNNGNTYLCAYYATNDEVNENFQKELKIHLSENLPEYMMPAVFIKVDRIPLNANGKVDKAALPKPQEYDLRVKEYIAPRNETEKLIADIFATVLGISKVGIYDDFFELGGHSLRATKVVNQIEKATGVKISLKMLFAFPTVEELSYQIMLEKNQVIEPIPVIEKQEYYDMSAAQKRLYITKELDDTKIAYNMPIGLEITGDVEVEKLNNAFEKLVERHEALRTGFFTVEGKAVQKIFDKVSVKVEFEEVQNATKENQKQLLEKFVQPFDLTKAPLMRLKLVKDNNKNALLLFDMHHIISDGMSMNIVISELLSLYKGDNLQELKVQYKDYSAWMAKRDLNSQKEYWLNEFKEDASILDLATDYPRPQIRSFVGNSVDAKISAKLKENILKLCENTKTTEYMVLLSAIMIMFSKYGRQEDIVIGSPTSGRTHYDVENILGMFVNTLAMRGEVKKDKTYIQFLEEIKGKALKAYGNQEYPFEDIIENLNINRDMSRNPLFDIMFAMQNNEDVEIDVDGLKFKTIAPENTTAKFDITINVYGDISGYSVKFEYCSDLFKEETILQMIKHLNNILEAIVENPKQAIEDIEMIDEEEKILITETFNATKTDYPTEKTVIEIFEEQVEKTPDNIAVTYMNQAITYKELNQSANKLSYKLMELGVTRESFVAVLSEKSIEMIIGIIAILKAGGAYVPIHTDYPKDRIDFILKDSMPKVLLKGNVDIDFEVQIPVVDIFDKEAYTQNISNPKSVSESKDLIYSIYTSGTTGQPKGTLIEHKNVVRLVKETNYVTLNEETVILQTGAISFDASTFEIWGALLNGGKLCLVNSDILMDTKRFKETIENSEVNTLWLTSALFNQITLSDISVFDKLKYLLIGGEKLSDTHVAMFKKHNSTTKLINGYGPTENTTFTTTYEIPKDFDLIPIGKPIANTQVYILNEGKLCGLGIPGELCAAGDGVGRGYLNQEELTKEKFVDNPFGQGKLYRTGDLARWLPDGNIEYLGRIDNQVKIRGFRIELGEIEKTILNIDYIKDATVIVIEENDEKYICAYVVSDIEVSLNQIKAALQEQLPDYMIPSYMMQIDNIPLTTNGKIDKRKLPKIEKRAVTEYVAPRNETEELIAKVFENVLGVEKIGIRDNFFELGGHSLKATRIINEIEAETGVRIPLKNMFINPTVEGFSLLLINNDVNPNYEEIPKAEQKQHYPMSSAQKRLFFINEMDDLGTVYNMPSMISMDEEIQLEKVKAVLEQLTKRHELLRTSFQVIDGEAVQVIEDQVKTSIEYVEVDTIKDKKQLIAEFVRPFDLAKAPLLRMRIVKEKGLGSVVLFDMHHIISDGFSMNIIINEFTTLYNDGELKELKVQYKDYSEWMRTRDLSEHQKHWINEFNGDIPVLDLPLDYPRAKRQSFKGDNIWGTVSKETKLKLQELCRDTGTTEYMVLLSAFMVLLNKYSKQEDIIVGTPVSGRIHKDTEQVLGMFVNTIAMRGSLSKEKSFKEFLYEIKEKSLKAFEYQEYPFEQLIGEVEVKREASRNPLFDVMFALQNNEDTELQINGARFDQQLETLKSSKFDITLNMAGNDDGYSLNFEYCVDLFKEESMNLMMRHFSNILNSIVENPNQAIRNIALVDEEEQLLIMQDFNNTKTNYPSNKTVVEIFEEQVRKTPNSIAVTYMDEVLTYKELNEKANKLAYKLIEMGVRKEDFVAVLSEKNAEVIVGIVAIIKAGGVYVPIHTDYPDDRIQFILKDSMSKVLLKGNIEVNFEVDIPIINISDKDVYDFGDINNPELISKTDDLIYSIYTSGTTGQPKGTLIEHKNVVRLVKETNYVTLNEETVILQTGAISFDASTFEIWGALLNGGKLCLVDNDIIMNTNVFKEVINKFKVNTLWLTAALFNQITLIDVSTFDNLRYLLIGGEKLSDVHVEMFKKHNKRTRLINGYGPTENTTFTTTYEIPENFDLIPIGRPIANTKVYILDEMNLCGVGVPGELCAAGDGVGRGYLNRENLNKEKFIDNPFGEGKLYRTGDLARWLPDGNIEYFGRMDNQVKIRGFRVELGEIQKTIQNVEYIKDAAVIVSDTKGQKDICAYIVADREVDLREFKLELQEQLPDYMIPKYMMQIDFIPVTVNGKVDERSLPEILVINVSEYIAPRTTEEKILVEVFEEVLDVNNIGINDNFFELGGDSIKAIRVVSRVRERGYELSVKAIMEGIIISDIAARIEVVKKDEYEAYQVEVEGEISLSPIQRAFFEETKEINHFNQSIMITMEERVELDVLSKVLDRLTMQHDILRVVYSNGKLYNNKYEENKFYQLDSYVFNGTDEDELYSLIREKCDAIQKSFSLEQGPLFKVAVFKTNKEDNIFLCMHHLVVDGVSWRIIVEDMQNAYKLAAANKEIILPAKTASFKLWSETLNEYKNSYRLQNEKLYWHKVASKVHDSVKLSSKNVQEINKYDKNNLSISFSKEISNLLLKNACTTYNTNIEDLFICAIGLSVKRWDNRPQVVIDVEGHGREAFIDNIKIDRTVGWFTNIYPVVIESNYDELERNIVATKETIHRVPNKGMGYGILRYLCNDEKLNNLKADIAFNYLGTVDNEKSKGVLGLSNYDLGEANSKLNAPWTPIIINGSYNDEKIEFAFIWDDKKFTYKDIDELSQYFKDALEGIVCHCAQSSKVVNSASDFEEYQWTIEEFNNVYSHYKNQEIEKIYPLTSMQAGMMYHSLQEEDLSAYFVQNIIEVNSEFNAEYCETSLEALAQKYSVLRTAIVHSLTSSPRAVTLKNRKVDLITKDISTLENEEKAIEQVKLREADLKRGFDLENDSLMRITIVKLGNESYEMIWSFHHIIMDGWCLSLLLGDFVEYYSKLADGTSTREEILLEAETLAVDNYGEFIKWMNMQDKEKALEYWKKLLEEYEGNSLIPYDITKTTEKTINDLEDTVGVIYKSIDEEISKNLEALSAQYSVTVSTLFETVWSMILKYHTSQNDVIYGKVVSGRNAPVDQIENMIGLFINTVPVRVSIGEESIIKLAKEIQLQGNETTQYDYCSLAEIQRQVHNGNSLIQSLFIFENYYFDESAFEKNESSLNVEFKKIREKTGYPITLTVSKSGSFVLELMYDKERYSERFINILLEEFILGVNSLLNTPDKAISDVLLITDSEKEKVLTDFNDTVGGYPEAENFMEAFKDSVNKYPNKTAVICSDKTLTYKELDEMSDILSKKLITMGVKLEERVAITGEKQLETIVGIVAILKAGAAYVPIDPKFPESRKEYIIADSQCKILLTTDALVEEVFAELNVINLLDKESYSFNGTVEVVKVSKENSAYVIYTSGSTGNPKGVLVEHKNLLNLIPMCLSGYGLNEEDVVLQFASISFDQAVWDILGTLLIGATICLVERELVGESEVFEAYVSSNNVTVAALTPTLLADLNPENFKTLRIIESGGEAANQSVLNRWSKYVKVFNAYGPTEATVNATLWEYEPEKETVLVGKPLPNTTIYILNGNNLCGIGVVGEICIGGIGVARGYLNRNDLTSEKYIENPYCTGERIYRTGDLGKWMPDGNIQCLGRNDDQIKIRGYRIELGEIEKQMQELEEIKDSVAVVYDNDEGSKYICGYYTSDANIDNLEDILREYLEKVLPNYMVPSVFVRMDEFPKTTNGKIDKRALPKVDLSELAISEDAEPKTELEIALANIWCEILHLEKVAINENFFRIGGHSISVIRLINKIYSEFNIKLKIKDIFESNTISKQAQCIVNLSSSNKPMVEITKVPEQEYYVASSAQKRLFLLYQIEGQSTTYNMTGVMEAIGKLDLDRLRKAYKGLLRRHEILRTSLELRNGEVVQVIHEEYQDTFKIFDMRNDNSDEKILEKISDIFRPFKLEEAPLIRMNVIWLAEEKYEIYINMHHVVSDGTSMNIMIRDFVKLYEDENSLVPLEIQYKDYSAWQQSQEMCERLENQKEYWINIFKDNIPLLNIPSDYNRPSIKDFKGDTYTMSIDKTLFDKIDVFANKNDATRFMVMLAVYMSFIAKYSLQEEIVVGIPIVGRNDEKLEDQLGMFVNTLALKGEPSKDKSFDAFLKEIQKTTVEAYENQDYSFEELVQEVVKTRDMSRNPIFDVMFTFENYEENDIKFEDVTFRNKKVDTTISKFDITLHVAEAENGMELMWEYATSLFKKETIVAMAKYFMQYLENSLSNPKENIEKIECVSKDHKLKVIEEFNATKVKYNDELTVIDLFEAQVKKTPNNIALYIGEESITYKELKEKVEAFAKYLRFKGVEENSYVGILCEHSTELIVAIYATLTIGAVYVPINIKYPKDRIKFILSDCKAKFLLLGNCQWEIENSEIEVIKLFDEKLHLTEADMEGVSRPTPNNEAYVIYTSGTTGNPKGVVINHSSLTNYIIWGAKQYFYENVVTSMPLFTSIGFDLTVTTVFMPLVTGNSITIYNCEYEADAIAEIATNPKLGVAKMTPAHLSILNTIKNNCFSIKTFILGGEELLKSEADITINLYGDETVIYNEYGPTEATVGCMTYAYKKGDSYVRDSVLIGKPIDNVKLYIFNDTTLCGIGMIGELFIGGVGLAKEYLNRLDLTNDKFAQNPFVDGEKIYRTGDLVRWLPDGNMEYFGRIDEQIKIRGFRIELGEIESAIFHSDMVKKAIVTSKKGLDGQPYLCAYYIPMYSKVENFEEQLKQKLRDSLPEYMIPRFFISIDEVPLTANGKVDKKMLPEPEWENSIKEYVAPENETQEKLVTIWTQMLKVEPIGIDDDFFKLGGHSLKATHMLVKIEEIFGVNLMVKDIFLNTTIRELSKLIAKGQNDNVIYKAIDKVEEKEYYDASSAQKRMYLLYQLSGKTTAYNMPFIFKINGKLEEERIKRACYKLLERHEILRTSIELFEGEIIQKVHPIDEFKEFLEIIELEGASEDYVKELEKLRKEFFKPFVLEVAPLIRMQLIKLGEEQYEMDIDMHHVVSDGKSMNILVRDLIDLYEDEEQLEQLKIQYKDYSHWQQSPEIQMALEKQKNYWVNKFSGEIPQLELPTDYIRPREKDFKGDLFNCSINSRITEKIRKTAVETKATTFMVMMAGFMGMLSKYSMQEDIIVGIPIEGRRNKDIQEQLGMYINTLAIRGETKKDKRFLDFLNEIKEEMLNSYENQEYAFEQLVEEVAVERVMSRNPIFDVMFSLQNNESLHIEKNGIVFSSDIVENNVSKFDITLNAKENAETIDLAWEYATSLFKQAGIKLISEHYINFLDNSLSNMEASIGEIDMLSEEEKTTVLYNFNKTEHPYDYDKTIVDLFEEQVELNPNEIAVVFENEEITYKTLNDRANAIAHILKDLGVKQEEFVAITGRKRIETIIGILGTLKVGAAYVPIDVSYPIERKKYILESCEIKQVLITDEESKASFDQCNVIDLREAKLYNSQYLNLKLQMTPSNLAYIIFTSGSTGMPKGVMVEHRGVSNLKTMFKKTYESGEDRILQFASISFDASVWEMFSALLNGKRLYIVDEIRNDVRQIESYINENKITMATLTPTYINELEIEKLISLRCLASAGSEISIALLKKIAESNIRCFNAYGPTESTVHTCDWEYKKSEEIISKTVPIGKPIINTQMYILNGDILCGIGEVGELCIGSVGLARGYLNNPKLTEEKFTEHPYIKGKRIYRTGDLARWLPTGDIEYIGRIDNQVKIRGFRIEIGEIETVISNMNIFKESAVVAFTDASGNKYLAAYYTLEEDVDKKEAEIVVKEKLKEMLPDYMIPSLFVFIDEMPTTVSGKVDKKKLPKPDITNMFKTEYVAPSDELETILAKLWSEILGIEQIGIEDNFFNLGGDSIKAIRLISKLRGIGYVLTMRDLMANPEIKVLKQFVKELQEESTDESLESFEETKEVEIVEKQIVQVKDMINTYDSNRDSSKIKCKYEMTAMQELFYNSDNASIKIVEKFDEKYTLVQVMDVVKRMIKDYDILRSAVDVDNNRFMIEYDFNDNWEIPVVYEDQSGITNGELHQLTTELLTDRKPFIDGQMLTKIMIHYSKNGQITLYLYVHHMIWDAMSTDVFRAQLHKYLNDLHYTFLEKFNYQTYIDEITRNSVNKNVLSLMKYSEIRHLFSDINLFSKLVEKDKKMLNVVFSIRVSDKVIDFYEQNPINTFLFILSETIFKDVDVKSIPILLIYHGRSGTNTDYSNTLGLFLDLIPMSFKKNQNVMNMNVQKNIDSILKIRNKEKVHFMSMISGWSQQGKEFGKEDKKDINNINIDLIPCINFLGMYNINKTSKEEYFEVKKEQSNFMFAADYSEEMLHFSISCYEDKKDTIVEQFKKVINVIQENLSDK